MEYNNINRAIQTYLEKWEGWRIAIYPFGKMGMKAKEILNLRYGIMESVIVDNQLAHVNPHIVSLNEIDNFKEYIWILTCENPKFHAEIRQSVETLVPPNQIIDVFDKLLPDAQRLDYSPKYRLLSRLNSKEMEEVSLPCEEFIALIEKKKLEGRIISVAEIGIGAGASAVEVCKRLETEDTYYFFDYEDKVEDLLYDLGELPDVNCALVGMGNTHKICDSYNWNLCKLLFQMRNNNLQGIFDIVYLDGAHTFLYDATACCLLKELLKSDGYIIFDDLRWTLGDEYPEAKDMYTEEQLNDCQVQRVVNAFMIEDQRFQQIYMTESLNPERAVYKKNRSLKLTL